MGRWEAPLPLGRSDNALGICPKVRRCSASAQRCRQAVQQSTECSAEWQAEAETQNSIYYETELMAVVRRREDETVVQAESSRRQEVQAVRCSRNGAGVQTAQAARRVHRAPRGASR